MRTRMMLTLAAFAVGAALLLPAPRAQAVTLPAPSAIGTAAVQVDPVEKASGYVCRRYWNGYVWVRRCFYRYGGPYYGPSYGPYYRPYYRPYRPYYYGRRYYWRW